MKPLKIQFKNYVQFSDNIEDRLINPHIEAAFRYRIKPLLSNETNTEMDLGLKIYAYTEVDPETSPELVSFYKSYVLEWWILLAYQRFIENHGRNVTQFGYTKTRDPEGTFEQVSSDERAVLLKRIKDDINISEGNVFAELKRKGWLFDSYPYKGSETKQGKRKSFGISAIGGKEESGCGCNSILYDLTLSDYSDDYLNQDFY